MEEIAKGWILVLEVSLDSMNSTRQMGLDSHPFPSVPLSLATSFIDLKTPKLSHNIYLILGSLINTNTALPRPERAEGNLEGGGDGFPNSWSMDIPSS